MDYGKKIIELREKKGWTQYRLHKESGINQPTLSRIEQGKNIPGTDLLKEIAKALGVSMAEFDDIPKEKNTEDLFPYVMKEFESMSMTKEEQAAYEKYKKMPLDEQQKRFLKTVEKFKSLSAEDQEALAKIIDSLHSHQK